MSPSIVAQIKALREAALALEHQAEFNMTVASRWPKWKQERNNKLISQSRELHRRADLLDPDSFESRRREAMEGTS